jgi:hypothetical protein
MSVLVCGAILLLAGNVSASSNAIKNVPKQPSNRPTPHAPQLPPDVPGGLPMFPQQTHRRVTIKDVNGTRDVLIEENSRRLAVHEDPDGIQVEITVTDGAQEKTTKRAYKSLEEWKLADRDSYDRYRKCLEERPVFPTPPGAVRGFPPGAPTFPRFEIPGMPPAMRPFDPAGSNLGGPSDLQRTVPPGAPGRWAPPWRIRSPWDVIPF